MKKNILIIDDDKRLRELLEDYLSEKNFDIYLCDDFESSKKILNYLIFDLIIVDRMMPSGDGINLIKIIKEKNNTPVILLTAMGESENKIEGLKIGADDYVSKPFEPEELYLRINKLLSLFSRDNLNDNKILFGDFTFNLNNLQLKKRNNIIYLTESENNLLIRILTIEQRGKGALVSAPFTFLCLASLSLTWVLKINTGYFFSKYRMYSVNLLNWRNLQF